MWMRVSCLFEHFSANAQSQEEADALSEDLKGLTRQRVIELMTPKQLFNGVRKFFEDYVDKSLEENIQEGRQNVNIKRI